MSFNINQRLNGLEPLSYIGANAVQPPDFVTKPRPPTANDSKNMYLGNLWLDTTGYPNVLPTASNIWMLVALVGGQATWVDFGSGTVLSVSGGNNITITGTAANPIVNVSGTTNHSVLLGNATGSINSLANGTTGQVLTAQTGADPIWASASVGTVTTLTGNSGGAVSPTAGNINVVGTGVITIVGNPGTSTLTVTPSGAIASSFPTDSGTATPNVGVLRIWANNAALNAGSSVFFSGSTNDVLLNVTDANSSVIIGSGSGNLTMNASAGTSVGLGPNVLSSLTTGGAHTAVGWGALRNNTTGTTNCAFGNLSLDNCTTGSVNSAGGFQSLRNLTTGSHNTGWGENVLFSILTGSYNCAVGGNGTGTSYTGAESSNILIMNSGVAAESNIMRIGTSGSGNGQVNKSFIAGIRGITTDAADAIAVLISSTGQLGTVSSSARFKENIDDIGSESNVLLKMRPVVFNYKKHAPEHKNYGLIAEEVAVLAPRLVVYDKDGIPETVRYDQLTPLLLNEFQKHCKLIGELQAINTDLLNRIRLLEESNLRCH